MNPPGRLARPLVPLTLAFIGGLITAHLGLTLPVRGTATAILILLMLLGLARLFHKPGGILGVVCFGLCGLGFYPLALEPPLSPQHVARLPQGEYLHLMGTLDSLPQVRPDGLSLELSVSAWRTPQGWRTATGRVRLHSGPLAALPAVGEQFAFTARLRPVTNIANPGSFDRRLFMAKKEIFVLAGLKSGSLPVRLATPGVLDRRTRWTEGLRAHCEAVLNRQPQPGRAMFKALLLGEQGEIPPDILRHFSRTGTSHVYSVGGLHMMLVAGCAFALFFGLIRLSPGLMLRVNAFKAATLLSLGPVAFYVLIAGVNPPAQRAALMIFVFLLLILLERQRDLYNLLTLAALVILIISPLTLFTLSFQLSFLCTLGLVYLLPQWQPGLKRWCGVGQDVRRGWRGVLFRGLEGLAVAAAATLATLPVVVTHFHQIPTYGLLTNLLVIPLFGTATVSLGLSALVASTLSGPAADALLYVGRLPLAVGLKIIGWVAGLPGSFMILPTPSGWQVAAYYLAVVCLFAPRRTAWTRIGVWAGGVILMGSVGLSYVSLKTATVLEAAAIDTRGEMAVLVTFPGGTRMVISAGGPGFREPSEFASRLLGSYLHARQVREVDYLVSLATTRNNANSLYMVSQEFAPRQFWHEGRRLPLGPLVALRNYFGDRNLPMVNLSLLPPPREVAGAVCSWWQPREAATGRASGPVALSLVFQETRLVFLPPARRQWYEAYLDQAGRSDVVFLGKWPGDEDWRRRIIERLKPGLVVLSGLPPETGLPQGINQAGVNWRSTAGGVVTVAVREDGWVAHPRDHQAAPGP